MANILVSIISAQTIPNILLIKEWEEVKKISIDKHFLITTNVMKSKIEWMNSVCDFGDKKVEVLIKSEDDITLIQEELDNFNLNRKDNYIINITGGTKILSLGVYQYFKTFKNTEFYYVNRNFYLKVPDLTGVFEEKKQFQYKLSVQEYMNSYGVKLINYQKIPVQTLQYTNDFLRRRNNQNFEELSKIDTRNTNFMEWTKVSQSENVKAKLSKIKFQYSEKGLKIEEIRYLSNAACFEEWCYHTIKNTLNLSNEQIYLSVEIAKDGVIRHRPDNTNEKNDNEIDIVFIYDNTLYVVEVKSVISKNKQGADENKPQFNDIVYKLAAIKDNQNGFGINVASFLFCYSASLRTDFDFNNDFGWTYQERANLHNIKLLDKRNIDEEIKKLLPKTT